MQVEARNIRILCAKNSEHRFKLL